MPSGFSNVPSVEQRLTDNVVGGNISGILSTRPQAKYMSGARCILRINGKIVGFAFGVSWNIQTAYRELNTVDNPLPEELVPRSIRVTGEISALHVPGQSAGTSLWQPDVLSFLFHRYITIEVRDSKTDQLLFYAPQAVITSRQESIKVDQLAAVSLTFMAIGFRDERDPAEPRGFDQSSNQNSTPGTTALGDYTTNTRAGIDDGSSFTPVV